MKYCKECNTPLKPGPLPIRSVTECYGIPMKEEIINKAYTVKCMKCGLNNHFEREERIVFDNTVDSIFKKRSNKIWLF